MVQTRMAKPGFSLIEIMVALMIIGVMAGSAIGLFNYVSRAKRTGAENALRTLKTAVTLYRDDVGAYPATLKELVEKPADAKLSAKWKGPYLDKEVSNDPWGPEYQYYVNAPKSAHPFELYSWGKDGDGSPEQDWVNVWNL